MLVQGRRGEWVAGRGRRVDDRVPDRRHRRLSLARGDHRLQPYVAGEGDTGVHRVDGPGRHARRDQFVEPLRRRTGAQVLRQQRPQLIPVGRAPLVGREPGIVRELRGPDHLAQPAELGVVARGDDQLLVGGGQRLIRGEAGVGVAHPERDHSPGDIGAGLVDHAGQRGGQEAGLDVLALAGRVPVMQGGQDRDGRVQARHDVEHRDARPVRRPVRVTGQAHQAGHGLDHEVVAGQVLAPGRAETADRGVDDGRVDGADRVVVEAELGEPAGLEVLHEDVRAPGELLRQREVALLAQVQRHRPLVAVDGQEVGGSPVPGDRRDPAAGVVAARALHLDHIRTEIAQQHGAVGPGQDAGEVRHEQARQRPGARRGPGTVRGHGGRAGRGGPGGRGRGVGTREAGLAHGEKGILLSVCRTLVRRDAMWVPHGRTAEGGVTAGPGAAAPAVDRRAGER